MIPLRDTTDARGPIWITLALIVVNLGLWLIGEVPHLNLPQLLVGLYGLWIFAPLVERQLGGLLFALLYLVLAIASGFLIGWVDSPGGSFAVSVFLPVLAVGLIHLAIEKSSRIICFAPIPFAATFFAVPTAAILVVWIGIEMLLTAV